MTKRGKFIVLEGLDGSGKSTQVKLLTQYLQKRNYSVFEIHFPRTDETSPIFGPLIGSYLRGDFGSLNQLPSEIVSLLYAGDRWNAAVTIKEKLNNGSIVISDRYVISNMAYQCAKLKTLKQKKQLMDFILKMEYEFFSIPRPDISIFLHAPIDFVAAQLSSNRMDESRKYLNGNFDIHEKDLQFQKRVEQFYIAIWRKYPNLLTYLSCMNKNKQIKSPKEIMKSIVDLLARKEILENN